MWHKWSNHLLPGEVFSCDECGKIFSSRSSQNRHIRDQHMHQHQNVICPICEKVFRNKNSLSNHVALYHKQRNWKIPSVIVSFAKTIVKLRRLFDCRSSLLLRVRQDFQSCFILPTPHQRLSWWCKHTGSLQIWPQGFYKDFSPNNLVFWRAVIMTLC